MNINIALLGQFIVVFAIFIGIVSYFLGRRKTETPVLAAFLGVIFSIVPIFGLAYVVIFMFKRDIDSGREAGV
ncbi:hypothetical protein [Microbulbifer thermotolerans]|uniref:Uncharacterized protein n=1 Tax=Microbulbifer thermotolerans TaxID=252514 RepID=A0A143HQ80_MICTH|nr:hypothetical protein [Microbulbifer thermotolerans]AMX03442.1 hypothetical protein A3224_13440 [Microbulbifer thermotolerans]MCX2783671.1 hypothetical protein [Microbulbifer thermotolerans]MCX2836354.1 hypothetical protein [Microbulbifer thermotolerans]